MRVVAYVIIFLSLSACTVGVWRSGAVYEENIKGFYLAEKKDVMFVSGKEYGYTFEINQNFKKILLDHKEKEIRLHRVDFTLDEKNKISGELDLFLKGRLITDNQRKYFEGLGLTPVGSNQYKLTTNLKGERYTVKGELPYILLENELFVRVKKPRGAVDTVKSIVATL